MVKKRPLLVFFKLFLVHSVFFNNWVSSEGANITAKNINSEGNFTKDLSLITSRSKTSDIEGDLSTSINTKVSSTTSGTPLTKESLSKSALPGAAEKVVTSLGTANITFLSSNTNGSVAQNASILSVPEGDKRVSPPTVDNKDKILSSDLSNQSDTNVGNSSQVPTPHSINATDPTAKTTIASTSTGATTSASTTSSSTTTPKPTAATNGSSTPVPADAPPSFPGNTSVEDEHNSSMAIFFVLCVLALGILLTHLMLQTGFSYIPESVVIVFLGALIGMIINLMSVKDIANWRKEEAFSPTAFFLVLLPPIIFESGYNLHKGNFFQNIGSILLFAIVGTAISALVIGVGVYLLGLVGAVYSISFVDSFAFGSLISAVDPVATVAIFHALDVDPILNMLVFGESILNDAVSIVLTTAVLDSHDPHMTTGEAILSAINRFWLMFFASAGIGVLFALMSALLLKYVDLRKNPSLEFGMMLVFTYAPYVLAEGIHLSGIMAILFCGIVMSHYTHFNLSTVTQVTMQQTMRTLAFTCETCVFAYLGLAIFSFRHSVEPAFVVSSLVLCLVGRACNIFPLALLCNRFREHKITKKMMFIMWFSGLRGAISYALSLHVQFSDKARNVIITTTLIIVLFTTLFFGGSTMPLLKFLRANKKTKQRTSSRSTRRQKEVTLSKTKEWGQAIDSEHLSEITEEELEVNYAPSRIGGFVRLDMKYFTPFFTRRFTHQELKDCKSQMTDLTNRWYQAIRITGERETDEEELTQSANNSLSNSRVNLQRGV